MLVVFINIEHIYLVKSILRSNIADFKHVFTCWEEQQKKNFIQHDFYWTTISFLKYLKALSKKL